MVADVDGSDTKGTGGISYLLKVALLTAAPLVLVSVVAGSPAAGLMALPAFGGIFGIEGLRTSVGWPPGEEDLWWVGVVLVAPTAFAVPTAVSMRLDPSVPQTAMVALVFLLPLLTIVGYGVLAGADRWLRAQPMGVRWVGLALIGLVVGGGLPAWVFVRSEVQEARVQEARQGFLEDAAVLTQRWSLQARGVDVDAVGSKALVRTPGSVRTVSAAGTEEREVPLPTRDLPYLDAGQLDDDPHPEMVVHGEGFNDTIRAFDHDGTPLWSYATPQGTLGSVATVDLDGDGRTKVAAGSTTGAGLRLLSPSGQTLWADTTLWVADIRAVGGNPFAGEEAPRAAHRHAPRLYAATGEAIRGYRRGGASAQSLVSVDTIQPNTARSGFAVGLPSVTSTVFDSPDVRRPSAEPVLAAGARGPDLAGFALSGKAGTAGRELWRRRLPASNARLAAEGSYLAAVGDEEGRIYVFDLRSGEPVAASSPGRTYRGAEWVAPSDSADRPPMLLGWTRDELVGLRIPNASASDRR